MPLKKLEDHSKKQCNHPEHEIPSNTVLDDGKYEYTCPACGKKEIFTVKSATL